MFYYLYMTKNVYDGRSVFPERNSGMQDPSLEVTAQFIGGLMPLDEVVRRRVNQAVGSGQSEERIQQIRDNERYVEQGPYTTYI